MTPYLEALRDSTLIGHVRNVNAHFVGHIIRHTRFRFDKSWRHNERGLKGVVYTYCLSTVGANYVADGLGWPL